MLHTIENVVIQQTACPLEKSHTGLKLFCGIARKYTLCTYREIGEYLHLPVSNIAYYTTKHALLLSNDAYKHLFKNIEKTILELWKN